MFMKAMSYILQGLESRISCDELDNLYIETAGLQWYEEEQLSSVGIKWSCGDEYIFISKEDCDKYNEYEIIALDDDLRFDGSVRRPYYRMRGKPVTKEQAFDIIRRTDRFFEEIDEIRCSDDFVGCEYFDNWLIHANHYPRNFGWIHADGTVGTNSITQTYPEMYHIVNEWLLKLMKFPYLDLVIAVTCWDELPNALWEDLGKDSFKAKSHEFEVSNDLFISGVEIGIHIHDKILEVLNPRQAIKRFKDYSKLYEKNKEVYIPEYYQENGIVQVDMPYIRRCIEAYGLDADEMLKKVYWHSLYERKE